MTSPLNACRCSLLATALIATVCTFALPGCRSVCIWGIACQPTVSVHVEGDEEMNGGKAARIVIYQLADDAVFRAASVEEFWREEGAFGDVATARARGLVLYPLEIRLIDVDVEPSTNFIAVAANLRHPEPGAWRHVFPVEDVRGKTLSVRVARGDVVTVIR